VLAQPNPESPRHSTSTVLTICLLATIAWIAFVWRFGFDMADEGYYWYGSQRLLHGGIPMRDFLAYDIGRYAWGAFFMHLIGDDGIVGARMSAALFQLATVALAVWLLLRITGAHFTQPVKIAFAFLATILLNLWVHPYYKSFDYGVSIVVIAMLVLMISTQSSRAWFGAGVILGLVAVVGRNHGVYGAFAAFLLVLFMGAKLPTPRALIKPLLAYVLGVVVGFMPNFVMGMLVDGFAQAFMTTLRDLVQSGSANIGLPIPWPWTAVKDEYGWLYYLMKLAQGGAFLALIFVPLAALARLARRPLTGYATIDKFMLALVCAAFGYAHYAFSRSDLTHLSHSIVPTLLIILAFGILIRRPVITAALLMVASMLILAPEKPYLAQALLGKKLSEIVVNGVTLRVFSIDALRFNAAQNAFSETPAAKSNFLALPNAPGLHAMYKTTMPIWEIYALSKRPAQFEDGEISRLQKLPPQMILLSDDPLDFNDEQRYSKMHPLTYQWIGQHYHRVAVPHKWSQMWEVYVRNP
jgi:hypothetical protein